MVPVKGVSQLYSPDYVIGFLQIVFWFEEVEFPTLISQSIRSRQNNSEAIMMKDVIVAEGVSCTCQYAKVGLSFNVWE